MFLTRRTLTVSGLGLAVLAGLAFVSFRTDPVPVDLHNLTRERMQVTINANGHTHVRQLFEIASPIAGTALRSPVNVGDAVVAGETVVAVVQPGTSALLDTRSRLQAEAALEEARAALHVAEADLTSANETRAFARTQFDRTQSLVERGVTSLTSLEDAHQRLMIAEAAVAAAAARVEMAQGAIGRAEASLMSPEDARNTQGTCCVELRAPADGVVLSLAAKSERPVSAGTPLLSIGDPTDLEVIADILSADGVGLPTGAIAYVERWGGTSPLRAQLSRINPAAYTKVSTLGIEEQRVDATFTFLSPPEDRIGLGDGYSVFLRIVQWEDADALTVPLSALFRQGDDWAVFVEDGGYASVRLVTIGHRNSTVAEVLDGLNTGETVITHPSDAISDGVRVIPRTAL